MKKHKQDTTVQGVQMSPSAPETQSVPETQKTDEIKTSSKDTTPPPTSAEDATSELTPTDKREESSAEKIESQPETATVQSKNTENPLMEQFSQMLVHAAETGYKMAMEHLAKKYPAPSTPQQTSPKPEGTVAPTATYAGVPGSKTTSAQTYTPSRDNEEAIPAFLSHIKPGFWD